jgi:hypothetical protein
MFTIVQCCIELQPSINNILNGFRDFSIILYKT